jgi:hypothetical protein
LKNYKKYYNVKKSINGIIVGLFSVFFLGLFSPSFTDDIVIKKPIFDTTHYLNKPKSNEVLFIPMTILYEKKLLPYGPDVIDTEYLRKLALSLPKSSIPYILDIESWKCGKDVDDLTASTSIDKYIIVIDIMKKVRSDLKFGYFGVIPAKAPITLSYIHPEQQRANWKHAIDRSRRLASHVDLICPEGYTYTNDKIEWSRYMNDMITEAKMYGKPIYPFLCPEFMKNTPLKGKFIPDDFWKFQLDFVYKKCDAVIIWGGRDFTKVPTVSREWDEDAIWWQITKEY